MADATVQPKISFLTDRPRSTWNTAVQYVDFCIENPHKIMANGEKFTTNQMEFDTNPKHNKIFLSAHANKQESVAGETAGIYVNQFPVMDLKIIYNIKLFPATPSTDLGTSKSVAKNLTEPSWGFFSIINIGHTVAAEKKFQEEQSQIHYIPAESRPKHIPYKINGRLTIRFVSDELWEKLNEKMLTEPRVFLYVAPPIFPPPPAEKLSLESCMAKVLERVEADQGVITFKVGPDAVSIPVNSCIVQSRIGVPLLREGLAEHATKEIVMPHTEVKAFKSFINYLYTQQLSDTDLHAYAQQLLALADQYNVPDLFYKMECFLCWKVQSYPASASVINTLQAAEMHGAATLKKACFETLYVYGQHLLAEPTLDTLPHETAIEMLRDFASRRVEHMPGVPSSMPFGMLEEEQIEERGVDGKRKRRVKVSGGGVAGK